MSDKIKDSTWEECYHEVGHYLASKGAPNETFSKYEKLAIEIRKLKERIAELENPETTSLKAAMVENGDGSFYFDVRQDNKDKTITKLREALEEIRDDSTHDEEIVCGAYTEHRNIARAALRECFGG